MIKLDKETYLKSEVEELIKPFEEEVSSLKSIVVEGNKAIEQVKTLEKINLTNSIKLEKTKSGLDIDSMFDLVDAADVKTAQAKINKLVELNKKAKIDGSYKPEDRKKQDDEYNNAEKKGDLAGMIKTKISKIFE